MSVPKNVRALKSLPVGRGCPTLTENTELREIPLRKQIVWISLVFSWCSELDLEKKIWEYVHCNIDASVFTHTLFVVKNKIYRAMNCVSWFVFFAISFRSKSQRQKQIQTCPASEKFMGGSTGDDRNRRNRNRRNAEGLNWEPMSQHKECELLSTALPAGNFLPKLHLFCWKTIEFAMWEFQPRVTRLFEFCRHTGMDYWG